MHSHTRLEIFEDRLIIIYPFTGKRTIILFSEIESIRIKHVYNIGMQAIFLIEQVQGKIIKIQFDFAYKSDSKIVELFKMQGVKIDFE